MSRTDNTKNEIAWEKLFYEYKILEQIAENGKFVISANQIKEVREPRLMTKFDHHINLPEIFDKNKLAILPITRGEYVIGHFDIYHSFEKEPVDITRVQLPAYVQSLNIDNITSEAIALNAAVASGIIAEFLEEEPGSLFSTVSGRMGSGSFSFHVNHIAKGQPSYCINVDRSQVEIDAAYEGINYLSLFEAKRDLADDFLVRQLYYPFRLWKDRVSKEVKTVFLIYSNGIYRVMEYAFDDVNNYNSLRLVKQKRYSIEDTTITMEDILSVLDQTDPVLEPDNIPFPQANSFERVINLCELIKSSNEELTKDKVTENYAFDERQSNYYTDAARYLGLIERSYNEKREPVYTLTSKGLKILSFDFKHRQLEFCKCILQHTVFAKALTRYLKAGVMLTKPDVVQLMKEAKIKRINENTMDRRSSSVIGWINWIVSLNNET